MNKKIKLASFLLCAGLFFVSGTTFGSDEKKVEQVIINEEEEVEVEKKETKEENIGGFSTSNIDKIFVIKEEVIKNILNTARAIEERKGHNKGYGQGYKRALFDSGNDGKFNPKRVAVRSGEQATSAITGNTITKLFFGALNIINNKIINPIFGNQSIKNLNKAHALLTFVQEAQSPTQFQTYLEKYHEAMSGVKKIYLEHHTILLDHHKKLKNMGLEESVSWIEYNSKLMANKKYPVSWKFFSAAKDKESDVDFKALNIDPKRITKLKKLSCIKNLVKK